MPAHAVLVAWSDHFSRTATERSAVDCVNVVDQEADIASSRPVEAPRFVDEPDEKEVGLGVVAEHER